MANKTVFEILAKLTGFGKADKGVKKLTGSTKKLATRLLGAAAAYKTFQFGLDSVRKAGTLEGVEKGFNNLRKQAGFSINTFNKLDKALDGTVDKMTLMTQANNAMLLGIADSEEQMADMFDVAQRLAEAVGQDATFGIDSLVTGLGRQSKLMLDNLGIIVDTEQAYKNYAAELGVSVDKLDDAQKKQAFVNDAMQKGKDLVKGLGKENETTQKKLDKFTTSMANFKLEIGEAIIESGVLDELTKYSEVLISVARNYLGVAEAEQSLVDKEKALVDSIAEEKQALNDNRDLLAKLNLARKAEVETEKTFMEALFNKKDAYKDITVSEEEELKRKQAKAEIDQLLVDTGLTEEKLRKNLNYQIQTSSTWIKLHTQDLEGNREEQKKQVEEAEKRLIQLDEEAKKAQQLQAIKDADADRDKKRQKMLQDLRKRTTKSAQAALSGQKTMAEAAQDAAKMELKAYIRAAVANLIKNNASHLAFIPPPMNAVVIAGLASAAGTALMQQVDKIGAQTGFEGVVDKPTQFTVGEGGAEEYVSVTPMEGVNNAGGQGMTINISGNVMSQDFIENELSEGISEAIRKGISFA